MNIIANIKENIADLSTDTKVIMWNSMIGELNLDPDDYVYSFDEWFDILDDMQGSEVALKSFYGYDLLSDDRREQYNPRSEYHMFNAYGNFKSMCRYICDEWVTNMIHWHIEDIIEKDATWFDDYFMDA